ncbi:MAG: acyltransferase [Ardenticatenaceae bacterium]|nr:acyltransferase [Ardenticatenaceae bacterium]MCB9445050.1 acyltransferase [Ardenticatenaceae bacterium]
MSTIRHILLEEANFNHIRLQIAKLLAAPLPKYSAGRFRTQLLRTFMGFKLGHGTIFFGMPTFSGTGNIYANLSIGHYTLVNIKCFLDLSGHISIGSNVAIGAETMVITGTHKVGDHVKRANEMIAEPVVIGDGAWIGSRSVIYPGVTIGEGAIVSAGSVVYKDVPPNTMVGGNPARIIQKLEE